MCHCPWHSVAKTLAFHNFSVITEIVYFQLLQFLMIKRRPDSTVTIEIFQPALSGKISQTN